MGFQRKPLTNDFSWSVSRASLFNTCLRAYYFNYYASWGGWEFNAAEWTRHLYMLKQIKTLAMWGGTIVHDTIKMLLGDFARGSHPFPNAEMLQSVALESLRLGWREAVREDHLAHPKATNLFELYYGNKKTLPSDVTDALKARIFECLENFAQSPIAKLIQKTPYARWKPIDSLDFFLLDGMKVWSAPDFAFTDEHGAFHIIDWKTGIEKKDELRLQLACYALFSMEKWHVPLEQVQLHGVFLRDGGRVSDYPIDAELLISAKDQILTSAQSMKAKLTDVASNTAMDEEAFPCTTDEYTCETCCFREACPQFQQSAIPDVILE